jgi:hypothetical protein
MYELTECDVLVIGGGPAGIGAALGAARQGADTLLIENHAFLGGVASFTLGMCINQMRPWGRPRSAVHELVIRKLQSYGDLAVQIRDEGILKDAVFCNVEYLKVALLDALQEAGARHLVHTRAADAEVEEGVVKGVIVATKRGLARIRAHRIVDCSGDADVSFYAGAETMQDRVTSPMTLCFNVTNVDMERALAFARNGDNMKKLASAARDGNPLIPDRWGLRRFPSSNCFYINHAGTRMFGPMDATDPEQLTRAEGMSRRQVLQMVRAMREHGGEALADVEIITAGPQLGIRETRRVKGEYVLTEEDCLAGRAFDDAVAWRSGVLDIGFVRTQPMPTHHVPYRSLVPLDVDGLLVAGRCISADHVAASAGKSMGNCMATGHAAGLAAALSLAQDRMPRQLGPRDLQSALRQDGVDLDVAGRTMTYSEGAQTHWRETEEWKR